MTTHCQHCGRVIPDKGLPMNASKAAILLTEILDVLTDWNRHFFFTDKKLDALRFAVIALQERAEKEGK